LCKLYRKIRSRLESTIWCCSQHTWMFTLSNDSALRLISEKKSSTLLRKTLHQLKCINRIQMRDRLKIWPEGSLRIAIGANRIIVKESRTYFFIPPFLCHRNYHGTTVLFSPQAFLKDWLRQCLHALIFRGSLALKGEKKIDIAKNKKYSPGALSSW